jgi:hypothetical protein
MCEEIHIRRISSWKILQGVCGIVADEATGSEYCSGDPANATNNIGQVKKCAIIPENVLETSG